jgi:hypothetical protein
VSDQRVRAAIVANVVNVLLFLGACLSFVLGVRALGAQKDLQALYLLLVGGLALKAATDMLRPRSGR